MRAIRPSAVQLAGWVELFAKPITVRNMMGIAFAPPTLRAWRPDRLILYRFQRFAQLVVVKDVQQVAGSLRQRQSQQLDKHENSEGSRPVNDGIDEPTNGYAQENRTARCSPEKIRGTDARHLPGEPNHSVVG